jgi:hypothetical protein
MASSLDRVCFVVLVVLVVFGLYYVLNAKCYGLYNPTRKHTKLLYTAVDEWYFVSPKYDLRDRG